MGQESFLHQEDFSTLIEAGFIAVKQGASVSAEKLFRAAQVLKPDHSAPVLGFGYIALHSMSLDMARHLFSAVLKKEPENALAKVLLGFSYLLSKFTSFTKPGSLTKGSSLNPQEIDELAVTGEKLIREALKESNDKSVHSLGESALELSKKITAYQASPLKS